MSRYQIKLYDFNISETVRDAKIDMNDPIDVLNIVDDCVDNNFHKLGKHFDRVVVYDTISKKNLLDYLTEQGIQKLRQNQKIVA